MLSAEELAQRAMDNAANAIAAGRKTLSRDEALGQEASSALLQGGTISDKVPTIVSASLGRRKWTLVSLKAHLQQHQPQAQVPRIGLVSQGIGS